MKHTYTEVWHGKYYAVGYYDYTTGNLHDVSFHETYAQAYRYADKKNGCVRIIYV